MLLPRKLAALSLSLALGLSLIGCSLLPSAESMPVFPSQTEAQPTPAELTGLANRVEALAPTTVPTMIAQARRDWRYGKAATALREYRQAFAGSPQTPDVMLEMGEVDLEAGEGQAALETFKRVLDRNPPDLLLARARLLLATTETELGNWEAAVRSLDAGAAPDGLADLVLLRIAQANFKGGDLAAVKVALGRPEMRNSTNRLILEQAGKLAERVEAYALAGDLYARGASYFGWTAERVRMYLAAGDAFVRAGMPDSAAAPYEAVVENYTWTKAAGEAGARLTSIGELTAYHHGILAISQGNPDAARVALAEAATAGTYAAAASARLRSMDEATAWANAVEDGMTAAYRTYRARYPDGVHVVESRFQEGLAYYEADRFSDALNVWEDGASRVDGDERARALLWAAKASQRLGRNDDAHARLVAAAETRPAGYYVVRSRDILAGNDGWPEAIGAPKPTGTEERAKVEAWIGEWAESASPDAAAELRARRGLGLAALGLAPEAEAELNAVIADSRDPRFLFRLAATLADQELWTPSSRAAGRVAALSPANSYPDAPLGLKRLIYPAAYLSLVESESDRRAIDPSLLLSLIHQESRYDQFAISYADARGLTQVMPATGSAMALGLDWPGFVADDLYRPTLSVQFGALYLSEQLKRFGGDPFRALAAYNAGPGPVPRWSSSDPDLFVERISYSQTQDYVRQVYLHHSIYRSLASADP